MTADKGGFPACRAAEGFRGFALTLLLEEPKSNASLLPVRGQTCWFRFIEDADAFFDFVYYDGFGFVEQVIYFLIPDEWRTWFKGLTEWLHATGGGKCIRNLVYKSEPRAYIRDVGRCGEVSYRI